MGKSNHPHLFTWQQPLGYWRCFWAEMSDWWDWICLFSTIRISLIPIWYFLQCFKFATPVDVTLAKNQLNDLFHAHTEVFLWTPMPYYSFEPTLHSQSNIFVPSSLNSPPHHHPPLPRPSHHNHNYHQHQHHRHYISMMVVYNWSGDGMVTYDHWSLITTIT